jgi:hypothetical protein
MPHPPLPKYAGPLEASFRKFMEASYSADVPEVQYKTMHDTFFCGALVVYGELFNNVGDKDTSEETRMSILESYHNELADFSASMHAEAAFHHQLNAFKKGMRN